VQKHTLKTKCYNSTTCQSEINTIKLTGKKLTAEVVQQEDEKPSKWILSMKPFLRISITLDEKPRQVTLRDTLIPPADNYHRL